MNWTMVVLFKAHTTRPFCGDLRGLAAKIKFIDGTIPNNGQNVKRQYSLTMVDPVQPTSDAWQRSHTTAEVKAQFPGLWDIVADESDTRNPTQIAGTVKSYRKIYDALQAEGFDGKILDASSGLGLGTKVGIEEYGFDVDDIEPYPDKDYNPKYKDYSSLNEKYDVIISNAVLNVLPQEQRDALVSKMGELLNDGGRIFVNVRGKDVESASSKVAIDESQMEYYISNKGTYQKGFTKAELITVIVAAVVLVALLITTFVALGNQKDTIANINKQTAELSDKISKLESAEKLTAADVETIVNTAIDALDIPSAGLTEAQVKIIVEAAIAGIEHPEANAPETGLTEAQVKAIVNAAISKINTGLSKAEVEKLIADAIAEAHRPLEDKLQA